MCYKRYLDGIETTRNISPEVVRENDSGNLSWDIEPYREILLVPIGHSEDMPFVGWLKLLREDEELVTHDVYLFSEEKLLKKVTVYQEKDFFKPSELLSLAIINATIDPTNGEPNEADREEFERILRYPCLHID